MVVKRGEWGRSQSKYEEDLEKMLVGSEKIGKGNGKGGKKGIRSGRKEVRK